MSSYIDTYRRPREGEMGWKIEHDWTAFTRRRLEWLYGPERAHAIMVGRDPKTQADIARWVNLGRRSAA